MMALTPGVRQAAAEVDARLRGDLPPAGHRHKAVPHVHANRNAVAVGPGHAGGEVKIPHRNGAENAAANPHIQIMADAGLVPDAAAHLDVKSALGRNGGHGGQVGGVVVLGAVQIHHMQVSGARVPEGPGLGGGIVVVDRHLVIVALIQPHGLAAAQINGGKQFHDLSFPL